jgi:hypothetical protein
MKCINCSSDLKLNIKLIYYCECGLSYSFELVEQFKSNIDKRIEWDYIRTKKLFKICDGNIIVSKIGNEFVHPDIKDLHDKYLKSHGR